MIDKNKNIKKWEPYPEGTMMRKIDEKMHQNGYFWPSELAKIEKAYWASGGIRPRKYFKQTVNEKHYGIKSDYTKENEARRKEQFASSIASSHNSIVPVTPITKPHLDVGFEPFRLSEVQRELKANLDKVM